MSNVVSRINEFPRDVAFYMVSTLFTARQIVPLCQVSRTWNQLLGGITEQLATNARAFMGIRFEAVRLTAEDVEEQWGQLTPVEAEALKIKLNGNFPLFYSELRPATIVLDRRFLDIRKGTSIFLRLLIENLKTDPGCQLSRFLEASFLARRIPKTSPNWLPVKRFLIEWAREKKLVPIAQLIVEAKTIDNDGVRIQTLCLLALEQTPPPSVKDLFEIIHCLPENLGNVLGGPCRGCMPTRSGTIIQREIRTKDQFLSYLALRHDRKADDAEKIADCIKDLKILDETKSELLIYKNDPEIRSIALLKSIKNLKNQQYQFLQFQQAMNLASYIPETSPNWLIANIYNLRWAIEKKLVPTEGLIRGINTLPMGRDRIAMLCELALRTPPPSLEDMFKIINSIPAFSKSGDLNTFRVVLPYIPERPEWINGFLTKDQIIRHLALYCDWEADDDAEKIAELIQDPELQQETKAELLIKKTNHPELAEKPFVEEKKSSE